MYVAGKVFHVWLAKYSVRGWQSISCVADKVLRARLAKYFVCD
jgi:hypothetical protein